MNNEGGDGKFCNSLYYFAKDLFHYIIYFDDIRPYDCK